MPPKISEGQDEAAITAGVDALLGEGWNLVNENQLEKTYAFKTYTKVSVKKTFKGYDRADAVGYAPCYCDEGQISKPSSYYDLRETLPRSCNDKLTNLQTMSTLKVIWTTHKPPGLSDKDIQMANYCDEQASYIRIVEPSDAPRCGPAPSSMYNCSSKKIHLFFADLYPILRRTASSTTMLGNRQILCDTSR